MLKILHLYPRFISTRPIHVTIPKRYTYFWEISNFLTKKYNIHSIETIENKYTTFEISKIFFADNYDVIIILARIDNIRESLKLGSFLKKIKPEVKLIFYGDIVNFLPKFFIDKDFIDVVVTGGDWEISLSSYMDYLKNGNEPSGIYIKKLKKEFPGKSVGTEWSFTNTDKAPINIYNDLNHKKELSITISKGCPYNCKFCLAVSTFGKNDRRKKVDEILNYIQTQTNKFESFKFFSPNFNFNNSWVSNFCNQTKQMKLNIKWASTSRIEFLQDEQIIKEMADAGCYKISTGIEIPGSEYYLNRNKSTNWNLIKNTATLFKKYNIQLKGLVMLGVPGQTAESILKTFTFMQENNIKIRPTSYSPIELFTYDNNLTVKTIEKFNKFTYYKYGINGVDQSDYFKLIIDPYSFKSILNL